MRRRVPPLLLLLLLPLAVAAQETAADEPIRAAFSVGDILWLVGLGLLFLGVLAVLGTLLLRGVSQQNEGLSAAEQAFEQHLIEEAIQRSPRPAPEAQTQPAQASAAVAPPAPVPASPPFRPASREIPPPPPDAEPQAPVDGPGDSLLARYGAPPTDIDDLARRLVQLTVLTDREGSIRLSHPPDGAIYRLRKGGLALLLPRLETEAFLAHQSRRFDVIFALTPAGEVLTVSRMAGRLNELMDRPGDFSPGILPRR